MTIKHARPKRRIGTFSIWRFASNRNGASAVEFALLLPILLLLLAGTLDLGHALTVNRKLDQIASTTGDVISQQGTWTKSNVAGLLSGMSFILQPYDTTGLTITVAVEDVPTKGAARVSWSTAVNTSSLTAGAASLITVPAKIQEGGVQDVLTRVQYKFTTPLSNLLGSFTGTSGYSFDRYFFNRPRTADKSPTIRKFLNPGVFAVNLDPRSNLADA